MDETFTFTGNPAGQPGNVQSFDGGDGNDTIDIFFDGETAAAPIVTDFTENPDGSFTATYRSTQSGGVDSVTITNIENVHIVLRNAYGGNPEVDASSDDIIRTGWGDDQIETRGGNDIIDSGRGVDTVDGGAGAEDVISKDFSDVLVDILWNIRTGAFTGPGSFVNLESFGTLRTGAGNDDVVTSDFTNSSDDPGDEIVFTGAGSDLVTVSNGLDHVDMGAGDDRLIVDYTDAFFPGGIVSTLTQNPDGSYSGEHRGVAGGSTRTGVIFDGVEHFTLIYPASGGTGGNLNDTIHTGDGNDVVHAGASSDLIHVGRGIDEVDGGETGTDVDGLAKEFEAVGPAINVNLDANTFSGPGSITNIEYFIDLKTSDSNDVVVTSNAADSGTGGDDRIETRGGDDIVTLFHGNDIVDMGAGNDRLVIDLATYNVFVAGTTMTLTETSPGTYSGFLDGVSSSFDVTFAGVEHFTFYGNTSGGSGSNSRDNIKTGNGDDIIFTYLSNDTVSAGGGGDVVDAGSGNDVVYGMAGNDVLDGGAGRDSLVGGEGNDRLLGGADVANVLIGGLGDDTYVVENGGDSLVEAAGEGTDTVETALASYVLNAANVENLTGTSNAGQGLRGNALDNRIAGGTGNDTLVGLSGNDTYVVLNSGDSIVEAAGQGSDTIETALASYVLNAAHVENLTGTSNAGQQLRGNALDNRIAGGTGNDTLVGLQGNDTYVVRNQGDSIVEAAGQGTDTVETALGVYFLNAANVENLTYTGTGDFSGVGNALANVITGGAGSDLLNGGLGADTLIGGAGNDRYLFDSALGGGNVDAIAGFASGGDRIFLENAIFTQLGTGALPASAFVTGTQAQDANDRIIYDQATGALSYDADGSGAGAAVQFATLSGGPALAASDFVVI